jgi:4-hydroxy-3-polyprenylbenzoate decarboxylase
MPSVHPTTSAPGSSAPSDASGGHRSRPRRPYRDLQEFVSDLEAAGELVRIKQEVDPILEISEITHRTTRAGGPALLFENVAGHSIPVLMNAYGSMERLTMALGVERVEDLVEEILSILEVPRSGGGGLSMMEKLKLLPRLKELSEIGPKVVKEGPCQEVVLEGERVDLDALPIIQCWPEDGGRFLTLPLVFTRHPETGVRNMGLYRMQVYDRRTTGMHWHRHKGGAGHYFVAERKGERLPVAVAIGGDPLLTYAASAPLPDEIDELLFAGFVRKRGVELVRCRTVDLEVPATAEIVLEGYVEPGERKREGPFGDHTGYYSLPDDYPVFHVTAVTHRRHPIYLSTMVGPPPQEDAFLGKTTERLFLPILKKQLPEIVDMNLPVESCFHNLVIVSIDKRYPGHARKVMSAFWGLGQLMFSKIIVVVDKDVNVHDPREVLWKATNHIDPRRDIVFVDGPVDELDHAAPLTCFGSKMGVDATHKWKSEGFERDWPDEMVMSKEVKERVDSLWPELGIWLPEHPRTWWEE